MSSLSSIYLFVRQTDCQAILGRLPGLSIKGPLNGQVGQVDFRNNHPREAYEENSTMRQHADEMNVAK